MTFEAATIPETGVSIGLDAPHALRWPSRLALAFGILTPIVVAVGMAAVTFDVYLVATVAAWVAIATSVLAVAAGVFGLIRGVDRVPAIAGIVFGVLGNPLVLLYGVDAIQGIG
ncbi:MAG: hypothetical protein ABIR17_03420 [Pseudolysinimonas sp.]|uniref:hypothetical protein n=1 Tax=Pseudolysinimonas sp. TaxID=2680009 RepID=UPI003262FE7F